MTTKGCIDISGLDKAALLAKFYNSTAPGGMGFFQAGRGPAVMTVEEAQELIDQATSPDPGSSMRRNLYYDYLYGRCLKIDLSGDELDPWGFDRDNGQGTSQRLVDELRQTQEVDSAETRDRRQAKLIENRETTLQFIAEEADGFDTPEGVHVHTMGGADVAVPLLHEMDREVERLIEEA